MLNMIKMDFYRMFKTKSLYITWIVLASMILFTTWVLRVESEVMESVAEEGYMEEVSEDMDASSENEGFVAGFQDGFTADMEAEAQVEGQAEKQQAESEDVQLGMSVTLPEWQEGKLTVSDVVYANVQSMFVALFIVIFTVIFATADIKCGYIKNIGGQVKERGQLIFSKGIVLSVYTCMTMVGYVGLQAICNRVMFGYLEWGNLTELASYMGLQMLLHCAFVLIIMSIAIILKNNVGSMIIAVCLCMNMGKLLYAGVDLLLYKIGIEDFETAPHTITGMIGDLMLNPEQSKIISILVTSVICILVFPILSSYIFKKRDI